MYLGGSIRPAYVAVGIGLASLALGQESNTAAPLALVVMDTLVEAYVGAGLAEAAVVAEAGSYACARGRRQL